MSNECIIGKHLFGIARKIESCGGDFIFLENTKHYVIERKGSGGKKSYCTIIKEVSDKTSMKIKLETKLLIKDSKNDFIEGNKILCECQDAKIHKPVKGSASHKINSGDFKGDCSFAFVSIPFSQTGTYSMTDIIQLKDLKEI